MIGNDERPPWTIHADDLEKIKKHGRRTDDHWRATPLVQLPDMVFTSGRLAHITPSITPPFVQVRSTAQNATQILM
jgi:hypothetical protein